MKPKGFQFGLLARAAGLALVLSAAAEIGWAQAQDIRLDSLPAGIRPVGIDITTESVAGNRWIAAVANSGEDSVSLFELTNLVTGTHSVIPTGIIKGIPAPYGVAACSIFSTRIMIVTSPSDNSVTAIQLPEGTILAKIKVGSQPYAASCSSNQVAVSNAGDNTVSVIDLTSFLITATISGVPGSHNPRGITVYQGRAWIAGTDSNTLTVVDLVNARVIVQVPVNQPTATRYSGLIYVASAGDNTINSYDLVTAQLNNKIGNVPTPLDFFHQSGLGDFAIIGGQNSLWRSVTTTSGIPPKATTVISTYTGIPGAAALAITPTGDLMLVTATDANSIVVVQQQPKLPANFGLSNGASFATLQLSSGSLASAFALTGLSQSASAASLPLPKTLSGVSLNIGGIIDFDASAGQWNFSASGSTVQAPLLFVGPKQVNFQIPPGIAPGSNIPVQLTKSDGTTVVSTLNIAATAPGIFTVLQSGQGQGAVLNQDFSQNGNPQALVGAKSAGRGEVIQIYATGAGDTTPLLQPGQAAPASGNPLVLTNAQPTVTIGGQQATVLFSGMAPGFVGLWQIDAQIPAFVTSGNAVPLMVSAGGVTSNTVTIAVQ